MAVYKFIGEGAGVPGLPHVVSDEYAEKMGVADVLKAAVKAGVYVAQDEDRPAIKADKSKKGVSNGQ